MSVASGEAAWESLAIHRVDLVVLDIMIPGIGGLGFLRKAALHPEFGNIPILVFTARTNMREFFNSTGTAGFVAKTDAPELLLSTIRNILSRRHQADVQEPREAIAHKILIVENDDDVLHHLVRLFKNHGMDPHPLSNPGDIVEAIAFHKPHAILLKFILPRISGPSIARMLGDSHTTNRIPIILYDDSGLHQHGDVPFANVAKFIPSPSDGDFIHSIRHVLSSVN